jgi:hypothetical protein
MTTIWTDRERKIIQIKVLSCEQCPLFYHPSEDELGWEIRSGHCGHPDFPSRGGTLRDGKGSCPLADQPVEIRIDWEKIDFRRRT